MDRKELGKLIKIERVKQDLTQDELAKKAGIGQSTMWFVEQGTANTNPRTLLKVLKALNLEIDIEKII